MQEHRARGRRSALLAIALLAITPAAAALATAKPPAPPKQTFLHGTHTLAGGAVITRLPDGTFASPAWQLSFRVGPGGLKLRTVAANDHVGGKGETVNSMAARTGSIAGVNGDFFRIYSDGTPINQLVVNGRILQSQEPRDATWGSVGINASGSIIFGGSGFSGSVDAGGQQIALSGVNTIDNNVIPAPMNLAASTAPSPLLITSALSRPLTVKQGLLAVLKSLGRERYRVVSLGPAGKIRPPAVDTALLLGTQSAGGWLQAHIRPGAVVRVHTAPTPHGAVQAIGSGPMLVDQGVVTPQSQDDSVPEAKTVLATDRTGTHAFFLAVDGGDFGSGRGVTRAALAAWLAANGAWQAVMFDDGGSAELVAKPLKGVTEVVDHPSDGQQRPVADGLFLYAR